MGNGQDLHQIEYRHHQTRDLSPVASSMSSPDSVRAWDSRIRPWIRHPHTGRLSESVCYQVLSNGNAALAWRYWDQRAAERADGTRGRPLVSRALVGLASVLTPEVAMALCRAGLTESVGPMPGEVPDGAGLPTVSADALTAVTHAMTPVLDGGAAQQAGLQVVVAAALADPGTPLAITIEDGLIQKPLREGVQCPLLWGLRRIAGPLLGPVGRDWSFSTFELPLGETDPASLPGIVFRQAQGGVPAPPTRWRKEVKVRPLSPDALDRGFPYGSYVEFAGWLVAEYQERGGDGFEQFIAKCCDGERLLKVRLKRVYDELRNTGSPATISAPIAAEPEREEPEREPEPEEPDGDLEPSPPEAVEPDSVAPDGAHDEMARPERPFERASARGESQPGGFQAPAKTDEWPKSLASSREGQTAPRLPFSVGNMARPAERYQPPMQYAAMSQLLKQLELVASDARQFNSILQIISQVHGQSNDPNGRIKCWEVMSSNDWYSNICKQRDFHLKDLASLFGIVVIPELAEPGAAEVIARWAYHAPPPMVSGLLAAARMTSAETWQAVMRILEPALAARWAADGLIQDLWDLGRVMRSAEPGSGDNRRGILGRRRRR